AVPTAVSVQDSSAQANGSNSAKSDAAAVGTSAASASASSSPKKTPRHGHHRAPGEATPPADASDAAPSAAGANALSIGTVQFTNGSAHFADYWIQPNYAVAIQSLNGTVSGLSSDPQSRATLKLEGKIDKYAPVHIDGQVNLLAATAYSDIKMGFKGV